METQQNWQYHQTATYPAHLTLRQSSIRLISDANHPDIRYQITHLGVQSKVSVQSHVSHVLQVAANHRSMFNHMSVTCYRWRPITGQCSITCQSRVTGSVQSKVSVQSHVSYVLICHCPITGQCPVTGERPNHRWVSSHLSNRDFQLITKDSSLFEMPTVDIFSLNLTKSYRLKTFLSSKFQRY